MPSLPCARSLAGWLACRQVRLMSLGQANVVACCLDAQKDLKGHVPGCLSVLVYCC